MRFLQDRSVRFVAVSLGAVVVAMAGAGLVAAAGSSDGVDCGSADGDAASLAACMKPAIAHIRTPLGFGSGVLLDNGYVVTNAHVVNPFDHVSVTIGARETVDDVPVVGRAPLEDIAVVGPIDHAPAGTSLAASDSAREGEDLFLVGFPVDFSEEPSPTITSGILSRVRDLPSFGLTYFETDAAIAHGQSGGALIDRKGHVLGISGLETEGFGLSLSSDDVRVAVDRILAGKATDAGPFAIDDGKKSGELTIPGSGDLDSFDTDLAPSELPFQMLGLAPAGDDRTLEVRLNPSRDMSVGFARLDTGAFSPDDFDFGFGLHSARPAHNGAFTYDVPREIAVIVIVANEGDSTAKVSFKSNLPLAPLGPAKAPGKKTIHVGDSLDQSVDLFGATNEFDIELHEKDRIDVFVGSPSADMSYEIKGPNGLQAPVDVDESAEGLLGHDAHEVFTAKQTGTYKITVQDNSGEPLTGYRITVSKPEP
jgi:hypothetical protein